MNTLNQIRKALYQHLKNKYHNQQTAVVPSQTGNQDLTEYNIYIKGRTTIDNTLIRIEIGEINYATNTINTHILFRTRYSTKNKIIELNDPQCIEKLENLINEYLTTQYENPPNNPKPPTKQNNQPRINNN